MATVVPVCPHPAVPQRLPTIADCSRGSCGISVLRCCTWEWRATGVTWPVSPSQWRCPWYRATLALPCACPSPPAPAHWMQRPAKGQRHHQL